MILKAVTVLILLFAVADGQITRNGACPTNIKPKTWFDWKGMSGMWNIILENTDSIGLQCDIFTYIPYPNNNEVYIQLLGYHTDSPLSGESKFTYASLFTCPNDGAVTAKFSDWDINNVTYYILDTDYTGYAVVYTCVPLSTQKKEYLWLLSRTRTLTVDQRAQAYAVLAANSIDSTGLVNSTQPAICDTLNAPTPTCNCCSSC